MAHVDAELDGVLDSDWKDASSIRSGNNNEDVQEVCRTGKVFISELCLQIKVSIKLRSEFGGCRIRIISVKELCNLKYLISGMGGLRSSSVSSVDVPSGLCLRRYQGHVPLLPFGLLTIEHLDQAVSVDNNDDYDDDEQVRHLLGSF